MSDETKSPRSDSPAGDASHPGQDSSRGAAPATGGSAANRPGSKRAEKTGAAQSRQNRVAKGTGALLSRITGVLRSAAEAAPGDPVIEPVLRAEELESVDEKSGVAQEPASLEAAGEKSFIESLKDQPRRGTGQLRVMVTGALRGPDDEQPEAENVGLDEQAEPAAEAPAVTVNASADSATVEAAAPTDAESLDDIVSRLHYSPETTGRLVAPFTGVLRGTDGLGELRAEMQAEEQQPQPEADDRLFTGTVEEPSEQPDADMSLLESLLSQPGSDADAEHPNIIGSSDRLDALEGLRSEARSQEAQAAAQNQPQQMWDGFTTSTDAEEEARLANRFAMFGGEPETPVADQVPQTLPDLPQPGVPHFDDAVMFPEESPAFTETATGGVESVALPEEPAFPSGLEEPARPAAVVEPAENVFADLEEPGLPVVSLAEPAAAQPEPVEPQPAPRGKRSESVYEDLRQTLAAEETEQRKRGTGGLLRRITGTLRRTTDSLRKGKTGPVAQPEPAEMEISPAVAAFAVEQESEPDRMMLDLPDVADETVEKQALVAGEAAMLQDDTLTTDQEPAGQESAMAAEGDWMTEIRQGGVEDAVLAASMVEETPALEEAAATEQSDVAEQAAAEETATEPALAERPRTITGRLAKIVTGILGGQSARQKTTKELEISDDLVTGRLQRSMVTGSLNAGKTKKLEAEELEETSVEAPQEAEATVEEEARETEPQNKGITGQLRSFITGILRSSEGAGGATGPLQTGDLPDNVAADRMEQNLPSTQRRTGRRTIERRETFDAQSLRHDVIDTPLPTQEGTQAAFEVSEGELLSGLGASQPEQPGAEIDAELPQDRFGMFFGEGAVADVYASRSETDAMAEGMEETAPAGETLDELRPEDIWGSSFDQPAPETHQPEETIWFVPEEEGEEGKSASTTGSLFDDMTEDALVAAYLGGQQARPAVEISENDQMSVHDMRAIALENYSESAADETIIAGIPAGEEEGEQEEAPAEKLGLMDRIARLTVLQKILLAEVVLLVVLLPFLAFAALTAPKAENPVVVFPMPHALPEGVPYPIGLTLTGGWRFDLQKSTFVDGNWKPGGSEWLEGTEVRRVVALPWNPQTDAVVRTFQLGDPVTLTLSNQDEVQYNIVSIERRTSTEADFLADRKLSLVILLYDEQSEDRWVITGER